MGVPPGFPFPALVFEIKKGMNTSSRQARPILLEGERGHVHLEVGKVPGNGIASDKIYYDLSSFVNFSLANTFNV
jgi:hypothetical protein